LKTRLNNLFLIATVLLWGVMGVLCPARGWAQAAIVINDGYYGNQFLVGAAAEPLSLVSSGVTAAYSFTQIETKSLDAVYLHGEVVNKCPDYVIQVFSDGGEYFPTGTALASVTQTFSTTGWNRVSFTKTITLEASKRYFVVVHLGEGAIGGIENCFVLTLGTPPVNKRVPYDQQPDSNFYALKYDAKLWEEATLSPVFILEYSDKSFLGNSYRTNEGGLCLYGANGVGQDIVPSKPITIDQVGVWIKTSSSSGADIDWTLRLSGGATIDSGIITRVLTSTSFKWNDVATTKPLVLEPSKSYQFVLLSKSSELNQCYTIGCPSALASEAAPLSVTYDGEVSRAVTSATSWQSWTALASGTDMYFRFHIYEPPPTETFTFTSTPTKKPSETFTVTPTRTSTPTLTATATPTSTLTRTSTPSFTPTPTLTSTLTVTRTPTATATPGGVEISLTPSMLVEVPFTGGTIFFNVDVCNAAGAATATGVTLWHLSDDSAGRLSWNGPYAASITTIAGAQVTIGKTIQQSSSAGFITVDGLPGGACVPVAYSLIDNVFDAADACVTIKSKSAAVWASGSVTVNFSDIKYVCPTSTFTRTPTVTSTPSDTPTHTWTPSSTPTATPTDTWTNTHTTTSTPSDTFTWTHTMTSTPTATATFTSTHTSTATASWTATFTEVATDTNTWTPTFTAVFTNTVTSTATPTNTTTPTASLTATSTHTSTWTPTRTASWTPTFTTVFTNTSTVTATPTPSFTRTPSFTPTMTVVTSVTVTATPEVPANLSKNILVPSQGPLTIQFNPPQGGPMVVRVVNVAGETVEKLVDEMRSAGPQWVTWNGRNKDGHLVGSGLYWVQIEAPTWTRRFSLIVRR